MPRTAAGNAIENIERVPPAQYSTDDQLAELRAAGNKLGLYDAVDLLQERVINPTYRARQLFRRYQGQPDRG